MPLSLVVGLLCALPVMARPLAGLPKTRISRECTIRCYQGSRWLGQYNHSVTACAHDDKEVDSSLDEYCRAAYPEAPGAKAYLNWPANPGSRVACKTVGNKCKEAGFLTSIWECPAGCARGSESYPVSFSLCAASQHSAWREGLALFRTSLCKPGHALEKPPMSVPFGDPPTSLCRNTQKECEISEVSP